MMLADKWPGQESLSVLIVFGTFLPAGIPGATPRICPEGPTRILDRGRVGDTVAHPAGQRSYRAEGAARAISVLDSRTGEVVKTIPTAFRVDLLALSEDGRWLYGMSRVRRLSS